MLQRRRNSHKLKSKVDICCYYDNGGIKIGTYGQLSKFGQSSVWDIEELVHLGKQKNSCPYYGSRLLLKSAEIVFCPYNYIIDPVIRSTVSLCCWILNLLFDLRPTLQIVFVRCKPTFCTYHRILQFNNSQTRIHGRGGDGGNCFPPIHFQHNYFTVQKKSCDIEFYITLIYVKCFKFFFHAWKNNVMDW